MEDDKLIDLAIRELDEIVYNKNRLKLEGYVVRMPKAYPVYDLDYSKNIDTIEEWLSYQHKILPNRKKWNA